MTRGFTLPGIHWRRRTRWIGTWGLAVLIVLGGALLAGSVAGCSNMVEGGDVVHLRFWNGFTGPDGTTMLAMIRRFNQANPDIQVTMQRMDWGIYYNKLFVAGLGGRAPEVFVCHTDNLLRLIRGRFVRPVDDMIGPNGLDANDFDANVWKADEYQGRHYGIPLDIHMLGMYYNKRLFKEAGIVDAQGRAKPPTNRAQFIEDLRKLKRDTNSDGRVDQWGFVFTWLRTNIYTLMRQNGGHIFNADRTAVTLASPPNIQALTFCRQLVQDKLVPSPENFDSWIGFLQGRVGIAFEGIYMLPDLEKQHDLDYGAAPLPLLGDQRAAWANSHNLCLRTGMSKRKLAAAKRLIIYLSDHSLDWAQGGQIPVRKSLRNTERFKHMTAQYAFSKQIPYATYMPQVPYTFEYQTEFDLALERALRGSVSPKAALTRASQKIADVMRRYAQVAARMAGHAKKEERP